MSFEDEPPLRAAVRTERGGPRLFLNGEERYPLFVLSRGLEETLPNFRRAGVALLQPVLGTRACWTGPEAYDWTRFDDFLDRLLEAYPGAFLLPRLHVNTPTWWKESHSDELMAYGLDYDDDRYDMVEKQSLTPAAGGHYFGTGEELWEAAFASERWQRDTAEMVQAYMRHVESSPYNARIMGYHVVTGTTGEWHNFGPKSLPGYGRPLADRCGPVPDPDRRMETTQGLLRDPAVERDVIDFYRCYHEATADAILEMAEAVKEGSDGRALFGTFYNYLIENVWIQEAGHLAPEPVLKSDQVDFLASPYAYQSTNIEDREPWTSDIVDGAGNWLGRARGVGGDGGYRIPVESARRRGKLFVVELDPSTHRAPKPLLEGGSGSDTESGTIRILERDLGKVFASGNGGWLYDFGLHRNADVGWYSGEAIIDTMAGAVDRGERRQDVDIGSVSEVAACYSAESFHATQHWTADEGHMDFFNRWFLDTQSRAYHRLGAPYDLFYQFDAETLDPDRYRLVFMPNAFLLSNAAIEDLKDHLSGSGLTVVWYYAPGYLSTERCSLDRMERLTGLRFSRVDEPGPMLIDTGTDLADTTGVHRFGVDDEKWPRFDVTDGSATPLGTWTDRPEAVAFARKSVDGWESVYTGTGPIPAEILRVFADRAGVRPWSDRHDVVTATEDAAMLTATSEGRRRLELHKPLAPIDGGRARVEHALDLDFGDVALFSR